ncbi:LemA family protein [soil metagenome]
MPIIWIVLGVVVIVILFAVVSYNRLVSLREQVRAAWAQIDVMLKRRYDLIPNLVETVKGYAKHEQGTLQAVIAARNSAVAASGNPQQLSEAEGVLTGAMRQMFALAESYPDLKANQNFLQLQGELSNTENQISQQRQQYNGLVASYNATILSFPSNLIAGPFGFTTQAFFELQDVAQREAPKVQF